ncbi:putative dehydrogenase [Pullulanibacillus pueri]|uniref:Dehydrogenase n=1 Tax=Pullulanibacillus pueri TaxID=1437324 RepID=A0A8J3EL91_9BACL|nr:Gfo/Idh/MocA family oxidoreductase [Pullulanibacillus pueri]MBM7682077.1 putative dehydrogenase [Pullulanibacillus pueri]GGH80073.1 dehydrogenase [Pullulanibacillus pueri]
MKVGIMSFAHMHAFTYAGLLLAHPDVELTAIWDDDFERGDNAAERFKSTFYADREEFLALDLDAVVICSENSRHRDLVVQAAEAGKHILCEKPIATEIEDAREMIAACKRNGVILQIAFPVRFAPSISRARTIIQSGQLGDILAVKATNHGQMPGGWFVEEPLSGGGAATDHIVHVMDIIRWTLQTEVKDVYAELDTRFYDIDVEDCGTVSLALESGAIATIDPSWSRPKTFPMWGDVTLEFVGTKGTLSVDALKQSSTYFNDQESKVQNLGWGDDMDQGLIDDFVQCVKIKREPSITGEDGLRTLEVVKAAYQSSTAKRTVPLERVHV